MLHQPVMLREVLEALAIKPDGCYVDCTFGRGGHSAAILQKLNDRGRLLALDRDLDAVKSHEALSLGQDARFKLRHASFSMLKEMVQQLDSSMRFDGILMDLGVSSPQLDKAERGFSFMNQGVLDMRMDTTEAISAKEWLARVDESELAKVLKDYGEERFAKRIARNIVTFREKKEIETTTELARIVSESLPIKEKGKHPATRTFQAIRIVVNREFEELNLGLRQALDLLRPSGRLVVITFHSLEDRLVKQFIHAESGAKYDPGKLPVRECDIPRGKLIKIGKALKAREEELLLNNRARSAVLRVAEKV